MRRAAGIPNHYSGSMPGLMLLVVAALALPFEAHRLRHRSRGSAEVSGDDRARRPPGAIRARDVGSSSGLYRPRSSARYDDRRLLESGDASVADRADRQ